MIDSKGTTYLIYSLSSISLTATAKSSSSGEIRASGAFTGVLRMVKLNDPSHKTLLDAHSQVYPTSVGLDYSFTDTSSTLIFTWNTIGDGSQLLMLTWPHHRVSLQNPNYPATSALNYLTTKVGTYFRKIITCAVTYMISRGGCTQFSAISGNCRTHFRLSPGIRRGHWIRRVGRQSFRDSSMKSDSLTQQMLRFLVIFTIGGVLLLLYPAWHLLRMFLPTHYSASGVLS